MSVADTHIFPSDAEALAREFKEFTHIVSHDFRAPLRSITEFSKLLQDEQGAKMDDEGRLYLALVQESGAKLQNMLDGVLEYSRLSLSTEARSDTDSGGLVKQAAQALDTVIASRGAKITITGELPRIHAVPQHYARVFSALLDNALKFTEADKTPDIVISAQRNDNAWAFSMQDNGIGVEKEFQERIFQPFRKLYTDDVYPGIGMGLAIVKKIVEMHGGKIWVESEAGQGAVFTFTIACREG